jgi:hypothetical protein
MTFSFVRNYLEYKGKLSSEMTLYFCQTTRDQIPETRGL